eukprot:GHUV01044874.1.p1 GENE.GHUV01044874.1~~GHUV01044874.1.p1  ORF type:complete len:102 (-),score=41.31 GHUV01044874.1:31-336(-)
MVLMPCFSITALISAFKSVQRECNSCSSSILRSGSAATAASKAAISPEASSKAPGAGTTSMLRCRLGTTTQQDCHVLLPLLLLLLLPGDLLGVLLLLLAET